MLNHLRHNGKRTFIGALVTIGLATSGGLAYYAATPAGGTYPVCNGNNQDNQDNQDKVEKQDKEKKNEKGEESKKKEKNEKDGNNENCEDE